ncbi:MAG: STAS domain-containing protein [Oscillospiraceae bacterium]|nr:STAS domain-containing protein [Oscillospiraceae bacterium]
MLDIQKEIGEGRAVFALKGRLDTNTASKLERELKEVYPELKELVLDFAALDYISSAGLRVLLTAHKTMMKQGEMRLEHVNENIQEIFEVTGFTDILTIV